MSGPVEHQEVIFEEVIDPIDGTRWRVDATFLSSNWRCVWGDGCQGILDEPSADLQQGCCSVGAQLLDDNEAMLLSALAAMVDPARFQFHAEAQAEAGGVFASDARQATRVVDGACVFFNRPGFAGGVGCALHLEAEASGEEPMDWKPAICWQLPLKIDRADRSNGDADATLRRWQRSDWGRGGTTMAWCCTDEDGCYGGDQPVVDSLAAELEALVGREVFVELQRRYGDRANP